MAVRRLDLPQRGLSLLPALPLESTAARPRQHRTELSGFAAHRRPRHRAAHRAGADFAAQRLQPVRIVVREPHGEARRGAQFPRLQRAEGVHGQSCLHVPERHRLELPGRSTLRDRRPRPEREQLSVRPVCPGRLGTHQPAHIESGPAVGLRIGHAQQQLRHAGGGAHRHGSLRECLPVLHRR